MHTPPHMPHTTNTHIVVYHTHTPCTHTMHTYHTHHHTHIHNTHTHTHHTHTTSHTPHHAHTPHIHTTHRTGMASFGMASLRQSQQLHYIRGKKACVASMSTEGSAAMLIAMTLVLQKLVSSLDADGSVLKSFSKHGTSTMEPWLVPAQLYCVPYI